FSDDDLDVDAKIVPMTEDFDDASSGVPPVFGKFENLDVDDHAIEILRTGDFHGLRADAVAARGNGRQLHALGNLHPPPNAFVVRDHVGAAPAYSKFADDGEVGALQDLDDFAVGPAIVLDARNANYDAVAVHGGLGGIARDVDIAAHAFNGVIGNQETVAVGM